MISAVAVYSFVKWLYSTRFGLAVNAIRDDEDKAEAMGVHTKRYKMVAWSVSAFFLGISGALFGNMTGFIEPLEVAFPTVTFRHFHGRDGAIGWQRYDLGAGDRRDFIPCAKRNYLGPSAWLAMDRIRDC